MRGAEIILGFAASVKRPTRSLPLRVVSRTPATSRLAMMRKPAWAAADDTAKQPQGE
jgi:hypothetical protein